MNINLLWSKGIIKELRRISVSLERLADCWEAELAQVHNIHTRPHPADTRGEPSEISYVDEEAEAIKELEIQLGKRAKDEEELTT